MDTNPAPIVPFLAQELVDIVIDHLHDDFETLHATSLVCRAWRPSSQLHLHRRLSLQPKTAFSSRFTSEESTARGRSFGHRCTFLSDQRHRHLIPYARELYIREGDSPWMPKEPSLVPLLTLILDETWRTSPTSSLSGGPGLRSVQLEKLDWRVLPHPLQGVLREILAMRTMRSVMLLDCYLPFGIPCVEFVGPSVKELLLDRVKLYEPSTKQPNRAVGGIDVHTRPPAIASTADPPASRIEGPVSTEVVTLRTGDNSKKQLDFGLESLEIHAFGNAANRLVSWLTTKRHAIQNLRSLHLYCDSRAVRQFDSILHACPHLNSFAFAPFLFRWDDRNAFPFPDISRNGNLRELRLTNLVADQASWLVSSLCPSPGLAAVEPTVLSPFSAGGAPSLALHRLDIVMNMPTPTNGPTWASLWGAFARLDVGLAAPESAFVSSMDADSVASVVHASTSGFNKTSSGATLTVVVPPLNGPTLCEPFELAWQHLPPGLPGKILRVEILVSGSVVAKF